MQFALCHEDFADHLDTVLPEFGNPMIKESEFSVPGAQNLSTIWAFSRYEIRVVKQDDTETFYK